VCFSVFEARFDHPLDAGGLRDADHDSVDAVATEGVAAIHDREAREEGVQSPLPGQIGRRCPMVLNDNLQKHLECLEQCDLEHTACALDREDDNTCDTEREQCAINCDLDYGP